MSNKLKGDNDYEWLLTRNKTAYQFLDLDRNKLSNGSKIRRAYLKKALELHPDKNKSKNAQSEFREVVVSYHILSDPDLRIKYDDYLNHQIANEGQLSSERQRRKEKNSRLKNELLRNESSYRDKAYRKDFRMRKLAILHKKFEQMKRDRQMRQNNMVFEEKPIAGSSDDGERFPHVVRVKWKNRRGISKLIDENVINNLMGVFGEIVSIKISSLNKTSDRYHYADVKYYRSISSVVASCHDYGKSHSLWNESQMSRISSLIRSVKLVGYDKHIFVSNDDLNFADYLCKSTLKIKQATLGDI